MDLGSMKLDLFHQAKTKESVKRLEGAVEVGLNLLDNIKSTITSAKEISAVANFLKSIDDVKASYSSRKPIIGVVGGTGTGKSSLINALLDHEALVPTSGIGACTAVITEIQYNHSSNENEKYRAEVEFIKAAEWEKELRILLDDISSAGPTNIDINSESNVAVAYNKLVTLYPDISKDDLLKGKHTAQSLAHDPSVAQLLGSTAKVSASTSEELLESLEEYIASKKKDASMAYWPLVKVVRIFAKVSVLESGLVIVDLPGTQDSNAARSAVAAKYVEKCTGLWVITPIIRATDDKTAQKLMGQSFRRQMQIDGTYSVVTFICSKTDDLSVTEMLRAMPEGEKAKAINEKLANLGLELKKLEEEPRSIKSRIAELSKLIENREKDIRFLEAATAGENSNEEKINFTSAETGIKRKQRAAAVVARKRAQRTHDESEDSDSSDSSEEELETTDGDNEELLTLEEACERIKKLKEEQAAAWDEKAAQKKKSDPLKKKKNEVQEEIKELKLLLPFECLQFRNRQGYQRLCGRLKEDEEKKFPCFRNVGDTQIPQLQARARGIATSMRQAECRSFLDNLSQCLTSLMVQVVLAAEPLKMADDLKEMELAFLETYVLKLRKNEKLKLDILDKFPGAVRFASDQATETAAGWEKPKEEGGMVWSTYRATCVREGVFEGSCDPRDLNQELIAPLMSPFSASWEALFTKYLPKRIDAVADDLTGQLLEFQDGIRKRQAITKTPTYGMVAQQTKSFAEGVKNTTAVRTELAFGQKDASRLFLSPINEAMSGIYAICGKERGKGTWKRMQEAMRLYIENHRHEMFEQATTSVELRLVKMMEHIQTTMSTYIHTAVDSIDQDHRSMIEGKNIFETFVAVRQELQGILEGADERFQAIAEAPDDDSDLPRPVDLAEPTPRAPAPGAPATATEDKKPKVDVSFDIKPSAFDDIIIAQSIKAKPEN
ncbi:Dynamin family domain containing protein [Rhypophila sp. PSN 637]